MMNVDNNDLIYKIQENTIKRSQKEKILQRLLWKTALKKYLILLDSSTKSIYDSILQETTKIWKQREVDCCRQDSWIKFELFSDKNFRESI